MIYTQPHENILVDGFQRETWGMLPTADTPIVAGYIANILTHFVAKEDLKETFTNLRALEEMYPNCELYAKETVVPFIDMMAENSLIPRDEIVDAFKLYFWGEE